MLVIPYLLSIFLLTCLLVIPFYFYNRFLIKKLKPREIPGNFWIYLLVVAVSAFLWITLAIAGVVKLAKHLQ